MNTYPIHTLETAPDGVRRFVNRRWLEIAGLSAEEAEGADWSQIVHPDDRERVSREWAAAIAAGREWSGRFRYLRPDGEVSWVDVAAVAVRDAGGEVSRWHGSVTDVTDMVLSQSRLAESEQRYRSVVATMAEGVVLQDPAGRIVTANEAACSLLGLSMAELMEFNIFSNTDISSNAETSDSLSVDSVLSIGFIACTAIGKALA